VLDSKISWIDRHLTVQFRSETALAKETDRQQEESTAKDSENARQEIKMLRELLEKCNTQLEDMQTHEGMQKSDREMMSQALVRAEQEILDLKRELQAVRADAAASTARAAAMLANSSESHTRKADIGLKVSLPRSSPVQPQMLPNSMPMTSGVDSQPIFVVQAQHSPSPRTSQHQSPRVVPAVTRNVPPRMPHSSAMPHPGALPRTTLPSVPRGAAHTNGKRSQGVTVEWEPQRFGVTARTGEREAGRFGLESHASDVLSPHVIGEAM